MDSTLRMPRRKRRKKPEDDTPDLFGHMPPVPPVPSAPARATDPETSHAAAALVAVEDVGHFSAETNQAKLLIEYDAAPDGLTDDGATGRIFPRGDIRYNGCRRRCSDLKAAGYIETRIGPDEKLKTRRNPGSKAESAICWITQAGKDAIRRLLDTGWSK